MNTHSHLNAAPTAALLISADRQPVAVKTLGAEVETRAGTGADNPVANNPANVVTRPFAGADASAGTQCTKECATGEYVTGEYVTGECITGSLVMIQ